MKVVVARRGHLIIFHLRFKCGKVGFAPFLKLVISTAIIVLIVREDGLPRRRSVFNHAESIIGSVHSDRR